MCLALLSALPAALPAGGSSASSPHAPLDGAFRACEIHRDRRIRAYKVPAHRGSHVCGIESHFATNRHYGQRFIAAAAAKMTTCLNAAE